MKVIKNSEELAKLVNEYKDLILPNEDVRIEFEPTVDEIRNVECRNLYLENDKRKFDFNGRNFNGGNFNGRNFNGGDFNGRNFNGLNFNGLNFNGLNFNGGDFNGWNFNGGDFNGKKISYFGAFICYSSCRCESIEGRRENSIHKVLDGEIEFIKPEEDTVEITVEGKTKRISRQSARELNLI